MQKKGKYVSVQEVIKANKEHDTDGLANLDKLPEIFGEGKMKPNKDEKYPAFKSPYIKNPFKNLNEKTLLKLKKLTKERKKGKDQLKDSQLLDTSNPYSSSSSSSAKSKEGK